MYSRKYTFAVVFNDVVRNLLENHSENTKNKVNSLLWDGLRLSDISVEDVERKQSYTDGKPGVIVAKMKNKQEKSRVMKEKRLFKDLRQFNKVFIQHDFAHHSSNFRRIVHAMNSYVKQLSMRGSRILYDKESQMSNSSRESFNDHTRENNSCYGYARSDRHVHIG